MHFRKIDDSPQTFILVFQTGDELAEGLLRFAQEKKLSAASFKAIGALSSVRLGWLSWERNRHQPSGPLDEQSQRGSIVGAVARQEAERRANVQVGLGKRGTPPSG